MAAAVGPPVLKKSKGSRNDLGEFASDLYDLGKISGKSCSKSHAPKVMLQKSCSKSHAPKVMLQKSYSKTQVYLKD
jgi:hypothetical protein